MAAQKCSDIVQKISSSSGKELLQPLRELNALINSASCSLRDVSPYIPLDVLFKCLNTSNEEQITLCKWTLKKLLPLENSDVTVLKHHDSVIEGLNHPSVEVRELCLSELERCSSQVNGLLALLESTDLLVYTTRSLADEDLSCAQKAANVLKNAAKHESGLAVLFERELQSEFNELLLKKDIVRFRVYEFFVAVQALSNEAFKSCKDAGVLLKLLSELDGNDVLLRMNCVELLTELANSGKDGLNFLEEAGVMVKLNNILLSVESDPMVSLMIPGVIKFFGHLAQGRPEETLQRYPLFLQNVFSLLSCDDPTLVPIAVETLGILAQTDAGLKQVFDHPARNKHIMKALRNHTTSSGSVVQLRALDALALIFQTVDQHPAEGLSVFLKSLYDDLGPSLLQMLMSTAKQPFQELRCASLGVMKSLAKYKWVQQDMITTPGFLEYLLDRHTEPDKAGKEHKYDLVVELVHSPFSAEVFDKPYHLRLREYEREGPFYVRAQATVALEEAN